MQQNFFLRLFGRRMGSICSFWPILVKLEHIIHVGHDHSLHRPGAAEAAGDQRAACSRAACACFGVRCPMHAAIRLPRETLWACTARVFCSAERGERGGMMHCDGEARTAAQGTANPACGSRGMPCDVAVWHAFGASELKKKSDLAHDAIVAICVTIMQECFPGP